MAEAKTQADRTADALLELNRAREVVKAARKCIIWSEDAKNHLEVALNYYDGRLTYDQYQSFLTGQGKKSAKDDTTLPLDADIYTGQDYR